jgi:hypothetical protein
VNIEMPRSDFERVRDGQMFYLPGGLPARVYGEKRIVLYSFSMHPGSPLGGNAGGVCIASLVVIPDEAWFKNSTLPLPNF